MMLTDAPGELDVQVILGRPQQRVQRRAVGADLWGVEGLDPPEARVAALPVLVVRVRPVLDLDLVRARVGCSVTERGRDRVGGAAQAQCAGAAVLLAEDGLEVAVLTGPQTAPERTAMPDDRGDAVLLHGVLDAVRGGAGRVHEVLIG